MVAYRDYRDRPGTIVMLSLILSGLLASCCSQVGEGDREEMIMKPQVDLDGIVSAIMNYITELDVPAGSVDSWRRTFNGERRQSSANTWEIGQWRVIERDGRYLVRKRAILGDVHGQGPITAKTLEFTVGRCEAGYAVTDCSLERGEARVLRKEGS